MYYVFVDQHGERQFYYWRENSAAKFWLETQRSEEICTKILKDFKYLYFSGISLAILSENSILRFIELLKEFKKNNGKVVFDNNYRP